MTGRRWSRRALLLLSGGRTGARRIGSPVKASQADVHILRCPDTGLRVNPRGAPTAGGGEVLRLQLRAPHPCSPRSGTCASDARSRARRLLTPALGGTPPAQPGLPGVAGLPGSVFPGGTAFPGALRGRALGSSSCAPAPPLPPSGSGAGCRLRASGRVGCGGSRGRRLPVWLPRRSTPSRKMSWMRNEVSGLA